MRATLLDGRALAAQERKKIKEAVQALLAKGMQPPGLAVILAGDDPASAVYVSGKERACTEVGLRSFPFRLPASTSQEQLLELIARLNTDNAVDGILVQLPLPAHMHAPTVLGAVDPSKDADGFHPLNLGKLLSGEPTVLPCTPAGILRLIEATGRPIAGTHAVVVGRSTIVGKPVSLLLLARNATVTMCHSATADLGKITRQGDILVVAAGRRGLITAEMVKEGAVVIDVGINRLGDRLVGDVDFEEVAVRAGYLTPVPGGVGPMTIAMLLSNTLANAQQRES